MLLGSSRASATSSPGSTSSASATRPRPTTRAPEPLVSAPSTILAIETSCDETAAAVIRDGREQLSSVVASQIPLHQRYGGVVPELAARAHLERLAPVVEEALAAVGGWTGIDAISVTRGPGLVGCLVV